MSRWEMIQSIVTDLSTADSATVESVYRVVSKITVRKNRHKHKFKEKTLELFEHMFYHNFARN